MVNSVSMFLERVLSDIEWLKRCGAGKIIVIISKRSFVLTKSWSFLGRRSLVSWGPAVVLDRVESVLLGFNVGTRIGSTSPTG